VVCGAVNIFQDISEIKSVEREREHLVQELERSNRELAQFSFAVSHDLQAPVRGIRALTQMLVQRTEFPPEDLSHLAGLIDRAADSMHRLIESLLSYAQAGQGELNRQSVPVDNVIDAVRASLAPLIAGTGAKLVCTDLPIIEADPVLVERVFQNLVANAIKYQRTEVSPIIEIWGEPFEDGWSFAVKDNGQGIPSEFQYTIFEPLKRLHGSDTPGTGLGLTLSRTIVARHGGRIWAESDGVGRGATFRFILSRAGGEDARGWTSLNIRRLADFLSCGTASRPLCTAMAAVARGYRGVCGIPAAFRRDESKRPQVPANGAFPCATSADAGQLG
jgi:light-regulated signal transduction histidine kinase (bacteriophytochrome)